MLMIMFSDALYTYASHEATIRDQLEDLYEMDVLDRASSISSRSTYTQARRPSADSQEQGNKSYERKRRVVKKVMDLKFGGLQVLCNKGLVRYEVCDSNHSSCPPIDCGS